MSKRVFTPFGSPHFGGRGGKKAIGRRPAVEFLLAALPEGPPEGKCRSAASLSRQGPGPARAPGASRRTRKGGKPPLPPGAGVDITPLCRARIPPTPTLHNGPLCDVGAQSARISEPERFWRQRRPRPARLRAFPRARRPEASEGDRADWRNRSDPGGTGAGRRRSEDARAARREAGGPQASRGARREAATVMGSPEQSGLQAPARRARPPCPLDHGCLPRRGFRAWRERPPRREGRRGRGSGQRQRADCQRSAM